MNLLARASYLLRISSTHGIMRRYFVVNGFDGALTMLGLVMGFVIGGPVDTILVINAGLGAAIALGVSGVSSAYISESAERRRALTRLETAMATDLLDSAHGEAARTVPVLVALVNGSAPFLISLVILLPLWLERAGLPLPFDALHAAIAVALVLVFLLGVFLGRIAGVSWIRSGLQTLLVALATAALVLLATAG